MLRRARHRRARPLTVSRATRRADIRVVTISVADNDTAFLGYRPHDRVRHVERFAIHASTDTNVAVVLRRVLAALNDHPDRGDEHLAARWDFCQRRSRVFGDVVANDGPPLRDPIGWHHVAPPLHLRGCTSAVRARPTFPAPQRGDRGESQARQSGAPGNSSQATPLTHASSLIHPPPHPASSPRSAAPNQLTTPPLRIAAPSKPPVLPHFSQAHIWHLGYQFRHDQRKQPTRS